MIEKVPRHNIAIQGAMDRLDGGKRKRKKQSFEKGAEWIKMEARVYFTFQQKLSCAVGNGMVVGTISKSWFLRIRES